MNSGTCRIIPIRRGLPQALVLVWLLGAMPAAALDATRSIFQYNCQTWRRQNGLTANGIKAIAQTKDGYLWLGTAAGLVRFDGIEFKHFDVARLPQSRSGVVSCLAPAANGGLWFGLEHGAYGFCDGTQLSLQGRADWGGLRLNVQGVLESKEGDLWLAAENQAARLIGTHKYEVPMLRYSATEHYDVMSVSQDAQGRIWLSTVRQGLFYWQDGALTKFPDPTLDSEIIYAVVEDKQGQIWVGTQFGLRCYGSDFRRRDALPAPWYSTRALLVDRQGTLWIGTLGAGLMRYASGQLAQLRKTDGLADDFVTALAEDAEGSLWVATRNGLSQLSDVKIPTFGKSEGLTADLDLSVAASKSNGLWVATSDGFTFFDGTAHRYGPEEGLKNNYVSRVFEASSGDIYLADGAAQIEVFSGGKVVMTYSNETWPGPLVEDDRGVVAAVGPHLFRVGTNSYTPYEFKGGKEPPWGWVFDMAVTPNGSLWVASFYGLCQIQHGEFQLYAKEQGLIDNKVKCLCLDDDGVIWAGLEVGMARFKDGKFRNMTREDGLFDNLIYAIVRDDYGNLWVDSSRGFFRVSRQTLNDFADGKTNRVECQAFAGLEAVKSTDKYQQVPSGCKTRDGKIWFPTAEGIVSIDPTNLAFNPVPPAVHIESVRANGLELSLRSTPTVAPGKGELEFHYAGISYLAPSKIQYRYRLEGYDRDWVNAGTRRSAFYTNLKPGKYKFVIQACNEDEIWNTTGTSFGLQLQPHYFQTAWFAALIGLSVIVGPLAVYGWRLQRLKHEQRQSEEARRLLEARVQERTAELAQTNSSLLNEIEERKRMQLEVEQIHRQLVDLSRRAGQAEVATNVLHNVGNVLNSVNVSAGVIADGLSKLRIGSLLKVAAMLQEHADDLGAFLTLDERGLRLRSFLVGLAQHFSKDQEKLQGEIQELLHNIDHIKEIVAMQQSYAKVSGVLEKVALTDVVESAFKLQAGSYQTHGVALQRQYEPMQPAVVDRHKLLQILANLLRNAHQACSESQHPDKQVIVRIRAAPPDRAQIEVADNGIGIAPENMTRIFAHGSSTKKNGHGFGLHSSALAAREMGGSLEVLSEGPGTGATFILEFPLQPGPGADR